ncbi:hypothetical protein QYF36_017547 [Acer negundo]|nr:hypothetical protein QYF36_017547 [Acer negundo]
MERVVL